MGYIRFNIPREIVKIENIVSLITGRSLISKHVHKKNTCENLPARLIEERI